MIGSGSGTFRYQPDCLFVFPPGGENAENYFSYSLGSAFIISYLRSKGYAAEQFVFNDYINLGACVKEILKYKARVIGFTVFNSNFLTCVLIAEQLKKASPGTSIIFGGPSATNYSDFILSKYPFIDLCFRNESEESFFQFISLLSDSHFDSRNIDKGSIKGITYRNGDQISRNPDCNVLISNSGIENYLDKYPSPYLNGVIPGPAAYSIGLITARGCNQNCTYCNCAVLSKKRFFTHSVERIIAEIDFISRYSTPQGALSIFDDAFSLIPRRAKTICKAIIEQKIKISLSCTTRCDCVDEELLDLMKEAGFVSIGFSLESANPKTLRTIGKVKKAEDIPSDNLEKEVQFIEKLDKVVSYSRRIGIENVFSSIMSGLPNETIKEANKTIETIDKYTGINFYSHNFLSIYDGTPLSSTYKKYGYKIETIDDNPIFSRTVYPEEVVKKVKISPKSHLHKAQAANDLNALKILSLHPGKRTERQWFDNIILSADIIDASFAGWLKEILAINGTLINIYSNREIMLSNSKRNYNELVRYCTPTLKIRNYFIEKKENVSLLISYNSAVLNMQDKEADIAICNFEFLSSNLGNPNMDFIKTLCRESDRDDAYSAYNFLLKSAREKNLFHSLINSKPFPYFVSLCKWTKDLANCQSRNTLIVNDKSELKLCWYSRNIGMAGQKYEEIIGNFEFDNKTMSKERSCDNCDARHYCIKCPDPGPLTNEEYCLRQKNNNLTEAAGLFMSFDIFKQLM